MSLAKELVENGHADVVLRYLSICRKFWQSDNGKLDEWSAAIREGRTPEFGSNLRY